MKSENDYLILADWGTSSLRANLCGQSGDVFRLIETVYGPGVKNTGNPEETFFALIKPWLEQHGKLPSILCGMIGGNIGWKNAPYINCPASLNDIRHSMTCFEAQGCQIAIAPGLTCQNPLGTPDILRGEETQILGYISLFAPESPRAQLLCLPGTHTKWAIVKNGCVETFLTSMQGELFDILGKNSVLLPRTDNASSPAGIAPAADSESKNLFEEGVRLTLTTAHANLIHTLFATRSRTVRENLSVSQAKDFLSGQTIGADVKGAIDTFRELTDLSAGVTLIGAPELAGRYATALNLMGVQHSTVDGAEASNAGLFALYRKINFGKQAA